MLSNAGIIPVDLTWIDFCVLSPMRSIGKYFLLFFIVISCGNRHKKDIAVRITCVSTGYITPAELIAFARSLKGVPYKYGSTDPAQGFDCSGFITYVFRHFGIVVPRQSMDFTFIAREISLNEAMPGDLVLFTGTDTTTSIVGTWVYWCHPPARSLNLSIPRPEKPGALPKRPFIRIT